MREWKLGQGEPLLLTLAADPRLCSPEVGNDQTWELELGGGDPSALALRTTFGLRARLMRIFPRFHHGDRIVSDPGDFASQPLLRRFTPNFLLVTFSPFTGINVSAEYWIPDSHTAAGRFTMTNENPGPTSLLFELCGQLVPMEGQPLAAISMQSANVLAGRSMNLSPVIFLTGGPEFGPGPYPSLVIDISLGAGESRTLSWVQASLPDPADSFDHARLTAARSWEAERTHLEMLHASQIVDIHTGDPDWDAAFAFTQKLGFSLIMGSNSHFPHHNLLSSREPDQGFSMADPAGEVSGLWNTPLVQDASFLTSNLPGPSKPVSDLFRTILEDHILATIGESIPGQPGKHGPWLAAPYLTSLAWKYALLTQDTEFMNEIFAKLDIFVHEWFSPMHDRDQDGFPEWDHPMQSGMGNHPVFSGWLEGSQGGDIRCAETPGLAAMLYEELLALAKIARVLDLPGRADELEMEAKSLGARIQEGWNSLSALYHNRDRDSHFSPEGKRIASLNGTGTFPVNCPVDQPVRVIVEVQVKGDHFKSPEVTILGDYFQEKRKETFERLDFQWHSLRGVTTTRGLFTKISSVRVSGLERRDSVMISVMDFSREDISLFLPLWAGIPSMDQAQAMITGVLFSEDRFGRPYGIPFAPSQEQSQEDVYIPWNAMIGEGLLRYGYRQEAALLTSRLMAAVNQNLKNHHGFYKSYHAGTGAGMGDRNALQGIAPLGLFMKTLGVEILSAKKVVLSGRNPFPWPVTVKYRGLTVIRRLGMTDVVFPDGQSVTHDDSSDVEITVE